MLVFTPKNRHQQFKENVDGKIQLHWFIDKKDGSQLFTVIVSEVFHRSITV